MPVVNIDDNIKKITQHIEQMTQEIFRLQGMLQTFNDLKKGGLETIDLPKDPSQPPDELKKVEEEIKEEKQ